MSTPGEMLEAISRRLGNGKSAGEARVFRGRSVDELIPRIQRELGPRRDHPAQARGPDRRGAGLLPASVGRDRGDRRHARAWMSMTSRRRDPADPAAGGRAPAPGSAPAATGPTRADRAPIGRTGAPTRLRRDGVRPARRSSPLDASRAARADPAAGSCRSPGARAGTGADRPAGPPPAPQPLANHRRSSRARARPGTSAGAPT